MQVGSRPARDACGWPSQELTRLHGVIDHLVKVPGSMQDCAKGLVRFNGCADELVVVFEFLPGHERAGEAALSASEGNRVLQGLCELRFQLESVPSSVRDLWVAGHIEGFQELVQIHQALRGIVQFAEGCTDSGTAILAHGIVLQGLEELVIGNEAWSVGLHEELEDLGNLSSLQRTVLVCEMLVEDVLEGTLAYCSGILRVGLTEGHSQCDDGAGSSTVHKCFQPAQCLLGAFPGLLRSIRAEIQLGRGT
mmetsp:Transcript_72302/g.150839  ORF Transcript_72302/g.150839 Transcript_72302/m.150839 type:complete len:251 (+) Transcript_72302:2169-2921(+)